MDESQMKYFLIVLTFVISSNMVVATQINSQLKTLFDQIFQDLELVHNSNALWKTSFLSEVPQKREMSVDNYKTRGIVIRLANDTDVILPIDKEFKLESFGESTFLHSNELDVLITPNVIINFLSPIQSKFTSTLKGKGFDVNWQRLSPKSFEDVMEILNTKPSLNDALLSTDALYQLFLKCISIEMVFGDEPLFFMKNSDSKQAIYSIKENGATCFVFSEKNNYSLAITYNNKFSSRKDLIHKVEEFMSLLLKE